MSLQVAAVLGIEVEEDRDLRLLIRDGFEVKTLSKLSDALNISTTALLEAIDIPRTTFLRRQRQGEPLHSDESDRLYRAARLFTKAADVLGARGKAAIWMQRECLALGGERPIDLLHTDIGVREAEDILVRIEHGVFS